MASCESSVRSEELVSVKRSILDIVIVQQQNRILELEEKLRKSRQEALGLQREKQQRWAGRGSHVVASEKGPATATAIMAVAARSQEDAAASTSVTPKLSSTGRATTQNTTTPNTTTPNTTTPKFGNKGIERKSKSAPIRSPQFHILPRYWTEEEHHKFLEGRKIYGTKNYAALSAMVGTRTPKQVRTHAQKYEMRIVRESAMRSYMGHQQRQPEQQAEDTNGTRATEPATPGVPSFQRGASPSLPAASSAAGGPGALSAPRASGSLREDQGDHLLFDEEIDSLEDDMECAMAEDGEDNFPLDDLDDFVFVPEQMHTDVKSEPIEV